jgi:hypothetical protein
MLTGCKRDPGTLAIVGRINTSMTHATGMANRVRSNAAQDERIRAIKQREGIRSSPVTVRQASAEELAALREQAGRHRPAAATG